uniref:Uncharacterized protein n=1 Tax=Anopheles melas TaxID=34690 RepID=A0A182U6V2_9DIPT
MEADRIVHSTKVRANAVAKVERFDRTRVVLEVLQTAGGCKQTDITVRESTCHQRKHVGSVQLTGSVFGSGCHTRRTLELLHTDAPVRVGQGWDLGAAGNAEGDRHRTIGTGGIEGCIIPMTTKISTNDIEKFIVTTVAVAVSVAAVVVVAEVTVVTVGSKTVVRWWSVRDIVLVGGASDASMQEVGRSNERFRVRQENGLRADLAGPRSVYSFSQTFSSPGTGGPQRTNCKVTGCD